ncbi:helix-turn-helix domain-containing protein [Kitasatospora humi]|uniref:helix-turn-helix domain-containing protein n=1 Tax=Kitasatospora humi TaxID=2893891 RepID=UPI0027E0EB51|nr:helix-turn-helix transcriptional regulator [Kitasatospora humi]
MSGESASVADLIRAAREKKGWSQPKVGRELGRAEGKGGTGPGRDQVSRWERGGRMPKYWLPYLVEVLDLDLADTVNAGPTGPEETGTGDTVESVIELSRRDVVDRRGFVAASSAYALAALGLPDPDAILRRVRVKSGGKPHVGRGEVAAIRQMTRSLGDAAAELGGGHARHLAVRYLHDDVAPWLDGSWTEVIGRELFAATAQLVHLAGWMAQDEGNQDAAQQYYAHSFRLASEAGNAELAATALRGLAVQAIDLGFRATAVRISEECVDQAKDIDDPRALAYYQATLANAAALDGDRRTATTSLTASQTAIERATGAPGESWASHYSTGRWAHEAGMILAQLGDYTSALDHLHHALDIHGLDRRRTRAIVLADLGTVCLRQDNVDGAIASWNDFLDCADGIRSIKVRDAVHDMRARLHRLRDIPAAEELDERAAALE